MPKTPPIQDSKNRPPKPWTFLSLQIVRAGEEQSSRVFLLVRGGKAGRPQLRIPI